MKDQFVPYEIAKMLKELGFDEGCLAYFDGRRIRIGSQILDLDSSGWLKQTDLHKSHLLCPLWQQVKQWLFNVHRIYISVSLNTYFSVRGYIIHPGGLLYSSQIFDSIYNQESSITAENEGIKKAVEYLYKNKK